MNFELLIKAALGIKVEILFCGFFRKKDCSEKPDRFLAVTPTEKAGRLEIGFLLAG